MRNFEFHKNFFKIILQKNHLTETIHQNQVFKLGQRATARSIELRTIGRVLKIKKKILILFFWEYVKLVLSTV
jgi:hypothetical protein